MDKRTSLRYRLSVEESLMVWLEELGEGARVRIETGRKMLRPCVRISAEGENCNPYGQRTRSFGRGEKNMLADIGLIPEYSYADGMNTLTFFLKRKKPNPVLTLVLIILSAVAVGILGRAFIPAQTLQFINANIVTPVDDMVFRILSCIAGPMIFLSVAWGIYGIGDVYTLGRIGKKLMINFLLVVFLFSLAGSAVFPLLGTGLSDTASQTSQLGAVFEMLLNIFPANIFSPFIEGNTLQIIFLAFLIGLSLIFLGQRTSSVAKAVEQINHIINFLMSSISTVVPYFVFIVLVQIIWSDSFMTLTEVWKFAVVFIAAWLVCACVFIGYVSARRKISPVYLLRSCLPSYLIALTTASSAATYESNMTVSKKKLGIDASLSSFGIPFGMVIFKPSTALYYILICFYFSRLYGVGISAGWIVTAVLITAVSAVATPPIPGGAAATYTMLFLELGIPANALAVAVAVDMVFDFILTSGDMLLLLVELFSVSSRIGMQDMNVVRKQARLHKE